MTICVFAGSSAGIRPTYADAARELGHLLASRHIGVVYGGAKVGLMGTLADAVLEAGGRVTGVIPQSLVEKEVAHDRLSALHVVASMHERKAMMSSLSDAFIALPGGLGTWEELFEVATWGQLGLHRKPCGLLNVHGYFDPLLTFIEHAVAERFVRREHAAILAVASTPVDLLDVLATWTPPDVAKWIARAST
jgi:uncharacterized protein (TIGR00730 family)